MFRNATVYRLQTPEGSEALTVERLAAAINEGLIQPISTFERSRRGFSAVVPKAGDASTITMEGLGSTYTLFSGAEQERILPESVIAEELAKRVEEVALRENRRVGARERKRLKESVVTELLPRAFVRTARVLAFIDWSANVLVVDTASAKVGQELTTMVREAVGRFLCAPLYPGESARATMTSWVINGSLPEGFTWGDECELRDPIEHGAIVKCSRQDLESDELREHLKSGKQVFKLGLVFRERLSFVLTEGLLLCKLRPLDIMAEEMPEEIEDAAHEARARFLLLATELRALLGELDKVLDLAGFSLSADLASREMREAGATVPLDDDIPSHDVVAPTVTRPDAPDLAPPVFTGESATIELAHGNLETGEITVHPGGKAVKDPAPESDILLDNARAAVVTSQRGQVSSLVRILQVQPERAQKLLRLLERDGVVSAADASGNRRVLIEVKKPEPKPAAAPDLSEDPPELVRALRLGISEQLFIARNQVRLKYGEGYSVAMEGFRQQIELRMAGDGLEPLVAAQMMAREERESPARRDALLAAGVEMVDPSPL